MPGRVEYKEWCGKYMESVTKILGVEELPTDQLKLAIVTWNLGSAGAHVPLNTEKEDIEDLKKYINPILEKVVKAKPDVIFLGFQAYGGATFVAEEENQYKFKDL